MKTLGFTNHYYTLWLVNSFMRYGKGEVVNGVFQGVCYLDTKYHYVQNLSMNYDEAVAKITVMAGEQGWEEDLDLRGSGSFVRTKRMTQAMPDYQFTFGKFDTQDIRTCTDVWQLTRAMDHEVGGRRRVYARKRLIELGEVVKYAWIERVYNQEASEANYTTDEEGYIHGEGVYDEVKRKYATRIQAERMEVKKLEASLSGHFYKDGDRITLKIKRIDGFSFEGMYGRTYIERYMTEDGKMVKYMGGSKPDISETEFVSVIATIQHNEYNGLKETKLKRIKVK